MIEDPLSVRLRSYRILLASGSPRRQEYLKEMGISFEVVRNPVDEQYPSHLWGAEISDYLSVLKADSLKADLREKDILITADTVVWHNNTSLAKPSDLKETIEMLERLSGDWHEVITSVCFTTKEDQRVVNSTTEVRFRELTQHEIRFYAERFRPMDKAGAYGIQEWLGMVAIEEIRGSYSNVVGLPTHLVYKTLMAMAR
ncbi:septum formation protein [Muriicola jejuensis]|uniref:dTTP/UTP pyrophosphatase n=1 Tax=Muriicola jejuensis TaxID=504488 RepID=A0A6P0UGA6_9FLAO|nr:Maf family nucleotide pyrophosphatase [Muriicola jejuensis]NER11470.1 septum formation protein Maf [Muriicola jejuensis]SMP20607.1 septum formation protein [Muriicola jejuensis]